jgi:uncharacterized protein YbjT (DUF2867 family)
MKIAVAGATGNVAGRALEKLVQAGADVTALVRHPEKLPHALRSKLTVEEGSLEDAAFVTRATRGARTLFWLTPPNYQAKDSKAYALGLAENAARAIRENNIQRVVFLSSHAADKEGFGPVSVAGSVEKVLASAAPHTVALRAAGFMENLFSSLPTLKNGLFFGASLPEKKYPLVATRDIGDVAAKWLLDETWSGHRVQGVHGPQDISAQEEADVLTRLLGKGVKYQQVPVQQVRESFLKMGASPSVADSYAEMAGAFAGKDYAPTEKRTPETTTPTTFETFVREVLAPRLR